MNFKLVMVDYVSNLSPCGTWRVEAQGFKISLDHIDPASKTKQQKKAKYVKFSTITNLSF